MKRPGILRRTTLKRGTKPLKRTRLRRVSEKRRQINEAYFPAVMAWKLKNPFCKFPGCTHTTDDAHHARKRGRYLMDMSTWIPLCRHHHTYVHDHPAEARAIGLLI